MNNKDFCNKTTSKMMVCVTFLLALISRTECGRIYQAPAAQLGRDDLLIQSHVSLVVNATRFGFPLSVCGSVLVTQRYSCYSLFFLGRSLTK